MQTPPSLLREALNEAPFSDSVLKTEDRHGECSILVPKRSIREICLALRDGEKLKFEQMMDLTAVDYLRQKRVPRFQVVYHFLSLTFQHRIRVKCDVEEDDATLDSIHDLWKCVNWYERECFDMYGIRFDGHPNLKRIIMYEGFEGHPLRKDYPIEKQQPLLPLREIKERHSYLDPRKASR